MSGLRDEMCLDRWKREWRRSFCVRFGDINDVGDGRRLRGGKI